MKSINTILSVISLSLLLGGCSLYTSKDQIDESVQNSTASEVSSPPENWSVDSNPKEIEVNWISSFNDSTLTQLVKEAQANNKNLQASAANVERARGYALQAGAALQPVVNLTAGGTGSGTLENSSANTGNMTLGLQVSWEADLWGRIGAGKRSAIASAEAVEADYRFSQHSLAANTATAFIMAIETKIQTEIVRSTLLSLLEIARIVDLQYENGMASSQDVALAKADLATARERLASIEGSKRDTVRALELLLGRYPAADLAIQDKLPALPPPPPAGLPSELLERRPDIVAAERRVAAAFNVTAQAKAAQLPTLSLTGTLGGGSNALSNILNPSNIIWQTGATLLAPVFDGGVRQAQIDIATAEQKQTLAAYGQAALIAFSEVEQLLDQGEVLVRREAELKQALEESERAYNVAKLRYEEGEIPLLDLLSLQQRVNTSESNLSSVIRLLLEQRVNLHLALGGGW